MLINPSIFFLLQQLGIGEIFTDSADFSDLLTSPEPLKVSKVIHKAFIDVNEEGAEAAAATGMNLFRFVVAVFNFFIASFVIVCVCLYIFVMRYAGLLYIFLFNLHIHKICNVMNVEIACQHTLKLTCTK